MSYQEDIDKIFKLRVMLEEEIDKIDKNSLYEYVLKNKSIGFLFCYLETMIEKHMEDYSEENKYKIENYLISSIFKDFEKALKVDLYEKCIKLKDKKEPNFMLGYNSCFYQKIFILSSQEEFFHWHYYIKKHVAKLRLKN